MRASLHLTQTNLDCIVFSAAEQLAWINRVQSNAVDVVVVSIPFDD